MPYKAALGIPRLFANNVEYLYGEYNPFTIEYLFHLLEFLSVEQLRLLFSIHTDVVDRYFVLSSRNEFDSILFFVCCFKKYLEMKWKASVDHIENNTFII